MTNCFVCFVDWLNFLIFARNEATEIHSVDVNGSQHGDVDRICIAPSSSSRDSLFAARCGSLRVFPRLCRPSRSSWTRRSLLSWEARLRFWLCDSFSDAYTRWSLGRRIAWVFFLLLALHGGRCPVHSFAHLRIEGKPILFLFRETTFYVSLAGSGASCASCFGLKRLSLFMYCHPERSEGSRVHKGGCFRDSSSLRSSEWQECSGWYLIMKTEQ